MKGDKWDLLAAQRAVFESSRSSVEKLVLLALIDHWSRSGQTFPSLVRLGHWCGLGRSTVQRAIHRLREDRVIVVNERRGRSPVYDLTPVLALPVPERDRCQSGTSVTATPHPSRSGTTPVPERDPKEPRKEPTEGTQYTSAPPKRSSKSAKSEPNPHAHGLKQFYVEVFKRTRGTEPAFGGSEWGRAMKAFGALADKLGVERAQAVIQNALMNEFAHRVQPWDLARDANNHVRPPKAQRKLYRQSGAETVQVNESGEF